MIAYLEGKVLEKDLESIILNVNGIGYLIYVTPELIQQAQETEVLSIWTYLAVRENALDLYGFKTKKDISIFKLLLSISGVGPKSAISILSATSVETLVSGIRSNDPAYLSKMSGISKKMSEKIVLNLKDKLGVEQFGEKTENDSGNQNVVAIDALVALGYTERDSREAVAKIKDLKDPESVIKQALKILGK